MKLRIAIYLDAGMKGVVTATTETWYDGIEEGKAGKSLAGDLMYRLPSVEIDLPENMDEIFQAAQQEVVAAKKQKLLAELARLEVA